MNDFSSHLLPLADKEPAVCSVKSDAQSVSRRLDSQSLTHAPTSAGAEQAAEPRNPLPNSLTHSAAQPQSRLHTVFCSHFIKG